MHFPNALPTRAKGSEVNNPEVNHMKPLTQAEEFRRERFVIYDDLSNEDKNEIRRMIAARIDFNDVADQFDTDVRTVWQVVFGKK